MQVSENLVLISTTELESILSSIVDDRLKKHFPQLSEPFPNLPELLDRSEVCNMLNISMATLVNWCKDGRLTPQKQGKVVRFSKREVLQLFQTTPKHKRV